MEYKDQLADYLNRCKENLDIIKKEKGYDFTQMFCNFVSAVILIKENVKVNKADLNKNNIKFNIIENGYPQDFSKDMKLYIRHLRNACCHDGITIYSKNGQISSVVFEDYNKDYNYYCKFEVEINEIEKTYNCLLKYINKTK